MYTSFLSCTCAYILAEAFPPPLPQYVYVLIVCVVCVLVVCCIGAGKSSLLLRYTQNEFSVEYMPTIGIDFRLKTVEVKGKQIKVQVW